MVGPALIAGIRKVDVDYGWFHLNEQTAPGYIMAVLQAFMLFNFVFTFNEPPPARFRKSIRRKSLQVGATSRQETIPFVKLLTKHERVLSLPFSRLIRVHHPPLCNTVCVPPPL